MPLARAWPVIASGILAHACSTRAGPGSGGATEHPLVGVRAPDFSLAAQHGGVTASLDALEGKVGVVDFWATWCDPCRESFPFYQSLVEEKGGDLVILGISEDDSPDGIAAFAAETGAKFPLAWDEGKTVARRYAPGAMPTCFVVDRAGIVKHVHEGFRAGDDGVLRQIVSDASR